MGKAFANSSSHVINKEEYTAVMKFDAESDNYQELWEKLVEQIQNHLSSENDDRVFRLLMPNFNLFIKGDDQREIQDMIRFIRNLKALVRSLNGVCLISVDEDLLPKILVNHLVFLADSVLKLTSFKGKTENL